MWGVKGFSEVRLEKLGLMGSDHRLQWRLVTGKVGQAAPFPVEVVRQSIKLGKDFDQFGAEALEGGHCHSGKAEEPIQPGKC